MKKWKAEVNPKPHSSGKCVLLWLSWTQSKISAWSDWRTSPRQFPDFTSLPSQPTTDAGNDVIRNSSLCKKFPWLLGGGYIWPLPVPKAEGLSLPNPSWTAAAGGDSGCGRERGEKQPEVGGHSAQVWRWEKENQVRTKIGGVGGTGPGP